MNDCINRGYVIDGYPSSYKEADWLFKKFLKIKQSEENETEEQNIDEEAELKSEFLTENLVI